MVTAVALFYAAADKLSTVAQLRRFRKVHPIIGGGVFHAVFGVLAFGCRKSGQRTAAAKTTAL
ncbi:MAG: hypothetical protein KDA96_27630, partial [Planctomycetaceae bacterium]|nr:hypothetical protein [Planctomycetaceae bacterium]